MRSITKRQPRLRDLYSVGPATVKDLELLGIESIADLVGQSAGGLYHELCRKTGVRHDPCCEDVFAAAIAQAEDPGLSGEEKTWWYWSRIRKTDQRSAK